MKAPAVADALTSAKKVLIVPGSPQTVVLPNTVIYGSQFLGEFTLILSGLDDLIPRITD